jgi:tellurite resistance protein
VTETDVHDRLEHFPIAFFASVMGLAGLTLALHAASDLVPVAGAVSDAMLVVTVLAFVSICAVYGRKAIRHPSAVASDWQHPVKLAFFPAISISLLLIATALAPGFPGLAGPVWLVGAALQAGLTLAVVSGWIGHRPFQPMHISPAWFIPAVGNVIAAVAGPALGFVELSWLFFSAGMMFWAVLLTLVMNRLIFHDPLPARLLPTIAILMAPPAVGFLAWLSLNGGQVDAGARVLLNLAYLFAAIVVIQAPKFRNLPFALSWWALSFPVAALTIASLRFGALTGSGFHTGLGLALLVLLVAIVAALALRTGRAIAARQICVPE